MALFGFKKKQPEAEQPTAQPVREGPPGQLAVKILGSGCANCDALEKSVREAMIELGIEAPMEHVKDFAQIAAYGVMTTPALVVGNQVLSYGKVLKKDEAAALLRRAFPGASA